MTAKVSILIAGVNEARFLVQHDLCEGKWRFNKNVCNSNQKSNHN